MEKSKKVERGNLLSGFPGRAGPPYPVYERAAVSARDGIET